MKIATLSLTVCLAAANAQAKKDDGVDVVGIKVGMSANEVVAALKKHDPAAQIANPATNPAVKGAVFNITSKHLKPDPATQGTSVETIDVMMTGAPDPFAYTIIRSLSGKPTLNADLVKSLREKYGHELVNKQTPTMRWRFDDTGKPLAEDCHSTFPKDGIGKVCEGTEISTNIVPSAKGDAMEYTIELRMGNASMMARGNEQNKTFRDQANADRNRGLVNKAKDNKVSF
jgi:hypothetical protein